MWHCCWFCLRLSAGHLDAGCRKRNVHPRTSPDTGIVQRGSIFCWEVNSSRAWFPAISLPIPGRKLPVLLWLVVHIGADANTTFRGWSSESSLVVRHQGRELRLGRGRLFLSF